MRRIYVLCFLVLTVVVLDILLFHTGAAARVQQPRSGFRVDRIVFNQSGGATATAPVLGTIVGFQCIADTGYGAQCFIASKIN
jgi:hypothetical protein